MNQLPGQADPGATFVPVGLKAYFTSSASKVIAGSDSIPFMSLFVPLKWYADAWTSSQDSPPVGRDL